MVRPGVDDLAIDLLKDACNGGRTSADDGAGVVECLLADTCNRRHSHA